MDYPSYVVPPSAPSAARTQDPVAVALGNASLLGVGYLMLRRWTLAVANLVVTAALVTAVVMVEKPWCEIAVVAWWLVVIAHGWYLGSRGQRATDRGRRLVALIVTVEVLLAVGILRFDAGRIADSVAEARESGNCTDVRTAQDKVQFGHRVANAPLAVRGDEDVKSCDRLDTARTHLRTGLRGDTGELTAGFDTLGSVLAEPGQDKTVDVVLTEFLEGLPTADPCQTVGITDWLRQRKPTKNALDRSADTVKKVAPTALVACGDRLTAGKTWLSARMRYQQLLTQYPGNSLTGRAQIGIRKATLALELAEVRERLQGFGDTQPQYCDKPAKYSGAVPYRKGATNLAMFFGNKEYSNRLPAQWRTGDVTRAALIVCADPPENGSAVQTCSYSSDTFPFPSDVTFYRIAIPLKVYEVRTGRLVSNARVQISGTSCPQTFYASNLAPPSSEFVTASNANIQAAFRYLIVR